MNEQIQEQADEMVADIQHSLAWARAQFGDAGQTALRKLLLEALQEGDESPSGGVSLCGKDLPPANFIASSRMPA